MDTKTVLKEVYQKSKTGQFAEVVQLIQGIEVKKEVALNILICASNACYNCQKQKQRIEKDEVTSLLYSIVKCIDSVEECQVVPYFQSVFHIIKYVCDYAWFEDLVDMEFVIIPTFLSSMKIKEDGKHIYLSLINKLSNSIFRLTEGMKTDCNNYVPSLVRLILKASSQINEIRETLSLALKFLNVMEKLGFKSDQLYKFYFIILENLARDLKQNKDYINGLPILVNIFSIILTQIIRQNEFKMAVEFLDGVETRSGLYFSQQEFINCHVMFKCITSMLPCNFSKVQLKLEDCKMMIKTFKIKQKKLFFDIIRFLEEPFSNLLSYYKSSGSKIWCELHGDELLNMLKFLREYIFCNTVLSSTKCSCGCSVDKNYYGTLKIGCQISTLLKHYLSNNKSLFKTVYSEIVLWQSYLFHLLKKVKTYNCKKWSSIYRELGTHTYNIGATLYHQKNDAFVEIYQCFLRHSLEFEGNKPELLKLNLNEVSFNVICEVEDKNCNVEKCMTFAALYCLLYSEKSNSVFQNWWIKSKLRVKEESKIQQLTLVSVLEKQNKLVNSIVNAQQYLTDGKKVELLSYELLRYKTVWKSKESLMAAFTHLIRIADVPKIAGVVLEIFGDGDVQLHDEMPAIFLKVTKSFKEYLSFKSDHCIRMALAVLYYYNYKDSSREAAGKNLEEMERTMQVIESAKEKFEPIPKDPNDECDIVSAYSNLRLSKFTDLLMLLNECVELIASLKGDSYDLETIKNIPKLLAKIGFEYRLHCFSIRCLQAFELSLNYAQLTTDLDSQLLAISILIENADTGKKYVKDLMNKGDELSKQLEQNNSSNKHSKILAIYEISKAKAYLHVDPNFSHESWKTADRLVTANESKDEFKFLRAELFILLYKLTKSCDIVSGEHERHPMTLKLHCAMDIVINLSHKNILCSYELCILFDTVYELAKVYYLMRMPRDLRAYSKNSVLLTQKIVLPMRCVSFLILLAHSDLLTCKFDHCSVKLNGVNDIFCLSQSRPMIFSEKNDDMKPETRSFENEIDICTNQIQELALDLPQHTRQFSPSSPSLVVESFKSPPFLSHEKSCKCFLCLSIEYQQLLMQKYHLDALYNMHQEETLAEEFIHGAFLLHKTLNQNYDRYKIKIKSLISEPLILDFNEYFIEYYGNILYDYSFHLMRKSHKCEALKTNLELIQLLKPKKYQYVYLYNDALLQRLSYIMPSKEEKSKEIKIETKIKNISLTPMELTSLQKTPTSKKSTVTVTLNDACKYSPPKRRVKKTAALFKSPSDTKIPKIHIFTDEEPAGSVRKTRRKQLAEVKQLTVDVQLTDSCSGKGQSSKGSVTRNIRKTLNPGKNSEINDVLKENCEVASSQQLPAIAGSAKTRSKLLTQKIKVSSLQSKQISTTKNSARQLLTGKVETPLKAEHFFSSTDGSETSSVILESPEHKLAEDKSIQRLEHIRASAKKLQETINNKSKTKKTEVQPQVRKTLLGDFLDNEPSSSNSTKTNGPVRKSTRNRVI